jgi:SulP family sulfate permease
MTSSLPSIPDEAVSLSAGLPRPFLLDFALPPLTFATLWIILPYSLTLAAVGLIESLMTLTLVDEITETRGSGNRECLGQGLANILCGFFGGMGGCAMIGQSLINVNSGGRGRLSGIAAAVCLLMFVLFLAPWIEMIPMAALVGVMFMVVIGTFEWASLRMMRKVPASDYLVMVIVAGYTVIMHDLASAVVIGVITSALVFAWQHAKHVGAEVSFNDAGSKIYQLHGPLFFASVTSFKDLFDPKNDPADVVIDFYYTRVYDQSGLEAINSLAEKYVQNGKRLHLTHLSQECRALLDRAGDLVEVNLSEDPQYHVATDRIIPSLTKQNGTMQVTPNLGDLLPAPTRLG